MVTIHNLEVRFDVEGDGDEAVFARMFQKYMKVYRRHEQEQEGRRRMSEQDRALGDRPAGGAW